MSKKLTVLEARELLRKYQLGKCSRSELEIINRWYNNLDDDKHARFHTEDDLENLRKEMLQSINTKIDMSRDGQENPGSGEVPVRRLYPFTTRDLRRIAAVLLIGSGLGGYMYSAMDGAHHAPQKITFADVNETVDRTSAISDPSTVYLSDGTVVWLRKGSRLDYPMSFTGTTREVRLTGEAFFDVARDRERPFVIHAPNFTTRVLGTSFNIKAYGTDDVQEVTVVSGKVVVAVKEPSGTDGKELVLTPNRKAIYSTKDHSLIESQMNDVEIYAPLKKQKLVFEEVALRDILKVLNATYNANISAETEGLMNCVITADLTDESLEVGLEVLAKAVNATYSVDEKGIILRGDGCGNVGKGTKASQ